MEPKEFYRVLFYGYPGQKTHAQIVLPPGTVDIQFQGHKEEIGKTPDQDTNSDRQKHFSANYQLLQRNDIQSVMPMTPIRKGIIFC